MEPVGSTSKELVVLVSQSSSFLTRAPRAVQKSVQDSLTIAKIDILGMGSLETAVKRAATGKRQVNFILLMEEQ
jgi:hypothetical protein